MASRFSIYSTGHLHSRVVCEALALGTRFPVVPPAPLREGGVAAYGFLRGLLPTLREAQVEGRPWVYADRGYFRARYGDDHSGYFRLTRDAWQHGGAGGYPIFRWAELGLELQPWRRAGKHILVCPPGDVFTSAVGGFDADTWLHSTLTILRTVTSRPVQVRHKSATKVRPLAEDLKDCHALVTYMSNTAVEALVAGVPVFCTGKSAAYRMGKHDLHEIEHPYFPEDRQEWAQALACNQWTLDEIRLGHANHLFD